MKFYVLIDADYMVYSAGFATESVEYEVRATLASGEVVEDICDTLDAATAWREGRDWPLGTRHSEPQRLVTAEPVSHAKLILKNIYNKIMDRAGAHFGEVPTPLVYLTGKNNFRENLATIKPYKGNRKALHKPVHYAALREYLVDRLDAQVIDGYEADDAVAMAAAAFNYGNNVIIAAVDKDLWTVPGWHYNFMHDEWSHVSELDALRNFYMQCLTGDPVDNIGGCWKCGRKLADGILNGAESEQEMYEAVLKEYEQSLARRGCPYEDAATALLENARLLHMLRNPRDVWFPPGTGARLLAALDTSEDSWKTSTTERLVTNTSRKRSQSQLKTPASSATSAEPSSPDAPGTPQTSASPKAPSTGTSKRRGGSRSTTSGGSSRSTKSISPETRDGDSA